MLCTCQWRGESEAAGEAARLMVPLPQSYFLLPLGLGRVSCGHNMQWPSVIAQYILIGGLARYKPPSSAMVESLWRSRVSPPGSSKESASYGA